MAFTLTTEMRNSLGALTTINADMGALQVRLRTGKKVSSAQDGASVFYQAENFAAKAASMEPVMADLAIGNKRIETAQTAITNMRKLVDNQLTSIQNAQSGTTAQRKAAADSYKTMLSQLNSYVNDSGMLGGENILKGNVMKLDMNGDLSTAQDIKIAGPVDTAALNLNASDVSGNFATDPEMTSLITKLTATVQTLSTAELSLGYQSSVVKARESFNRTLVANLNDGAALLTASDATEDAAMLSAIQTRQGFVLNSMNVSRQYEQNLLLLLR